MSDATDDLEMQPYHVRDRVGTFYVYWYEGKKHSFRSLAEANKWAELKGFELSTEQLKEQKNV